MVGDHDAANGEILILGATGFIGSRLIPLLLTKGYHLRLLVRDPEKLDRLYKENKKVRVFT
ncbi:MAG: NAD(P)H-binding protein, partial [Nitrospirota bacterium]